MIRFIPPLLIATLLLSVPLRAQTTDPADFDRLFTRAMELQKAGDMFGAIETYKAALTIDPKRADALSNLGVAYARLGQYDDAIAQYEASLKVDSTQTAVRTNLALAYYKSARPNDAIPHLRQVIAVEPQAKNAYILLADCYLQTGQPQDAVSLLQPRETMFGTDLAFAYLLGTGLLQTGDEAKGQQYVQRIFGAGDTAEGHLLMGIAHLNRMDYPEAKKELERALALNESLPTVNSAYGRALLGLADLEAAEAAFRKELSININDFEANLALGNLRKNASRFDEARAYLTRAVTMRPTDQTARKLLASLLLQTGDAAGAAGMLEALVKDYPSLVEAHVQLATAYNRLNRKEDADREREIVQRLNAEIQARQPGAAAGADTQAPAPPSTPAGGPQ